MKKTSDTFLQRMEKMRQANPVKDEGIVVDEHSDLGALSDSDRAIIEQLQQAYKRHLANPVKAKPSNNKPQTLASLDTITIRFKSF